METPSFTFRLERVKSLRERAEERAQEDLASELRLRLRGEAMLRAATNAASEAVQTAREVTFAPASAGYLLAAQTYIGRAHRDVPRRRSTSTAATSKLPPARRPCSPPPVELAVEIGRTHMTIRETLALGPGSIVTLNRLSGEPSTCWSTVSRSHAARSS